MDSNSEQKQHPQEKPALLIVEDDEDLRTQMKWALAGDYGVLLAGDRQTAMEKVRNEHPPWRPWISAFRRRPPASRRDSRPFRRSCRKTRT